MKFPSIIGSTVFCLAVTLGSPTVIAQATKLPERGDIGKTGETQDLMGIQQSTGGNALTAYFPFDVAAQDKLGNFEPIDGMTVNVTKKGKYGGALRLDGKTVVEIPIDLSADVMPEFTVSMWIKVDRLPSDEAMLKKLPSSAVIASNLLSISNLKSSAPSLYANVPGAKISARQHRLRPGQWTHVVITRKIEERENRKGEKEPHLVSRIHSEGRATESARPYRNARHQPSIYLGGASAKPRAGGVIGLMDDLKIFRVALNEKQIGALKSAGVGQFFPGDNFRPAKSFPGDNFQKDQAFPGDNFEADRNFPGDNFDKDLTTDRINTEPLKRAPDASNPTDKLNQQIEETIRGDEVSNNNSSSNSSDADEPEITLPGSIKAVGSNTVAKGPLEQLREAADDDGPTLSLPTGSVKPPATSLPTADASAEQANSTPLVPGGINGGPKSISGSPPSSPGSTSLPDPSQVASDANRPDGNPQTASIGGQPVDDTRAISQAKAARDWQLLDLALASVAEEEKLRSGARVKFRAIVARHDRTDQLPNATLALTAVPASGGPPIIQNTPLTQAGDGSRKTHSVLMELPAIGADGRPLRTSNIVVTGRIVFANALQGIDDDLSNNVVQTSMVINRQLAVASELVASEPCVTPGTRAENAAADSETTRSAQNCLQTTSSDAGGQPELFLDPNGLLVHASPPHVSKFSDVEEVMVTANGLNFLYMSERNDKVCKVRGEFDSLHTHKTNVQRVDVCDSGGSISFVQSKINVNADARHYATGIRVCRNIHNKRIKGASLEFRRVRDDGTLASAKVVKTDRLTNCAKWTEWARCPSATVAAGLRVHISDGSFLAPQSFVHSLDLMCAPIQIRKSAT